MTKAVLKHFAIFTGKYLCWGLFLIKNFKAALLKRNSNTCVFCEYCGIFQICFEEHLRPANFMRCYFDRISLRQCGFCTICYFKILVWKRKCKNNLKIVNLKKRKKRIANSHIYNVFVMLYVMCIFMYVDVM